MGALLSNEIGGKILNPDSPWVVFIRPVCIGILNVITEVGRLFPDSIVFGSLLLFFLTQNLPYGIFALFMVETSLFHKVTSFFFDKTSDTKDSTTKKNTDPSCIPGFRGARLEFERSFLGNTYPSTPMFFLGSIAIYMALVNFTFKETMDTMQNDWKSRFGFGIAMIVIWCLTAILLRGAFSCDPISEIGLAFFIGSAVGVSMFFANTRLFGIESVNFLGLPYLVNKMDTKNPLYVCTQK